MAKKNKFDPQKELVNIQAQQLALQAALQAAQTELAKARYENIELPQYKDLSWYQKEQIAIQRMQQTLQEELNKANITGYDIQGNPTLQRQLQESGLTGMLNGVPTLANLAQQAQFTGMYNGAPTWQRTLEESQLTGQYQGQQTSQEKTAALNRLLSEANATGYFNGQETSSERQAKWNRLVDEASMTGYFNGQQTEASKQAMFNRAATEAGITGMYGGQETADWRARQAGITGYFNGQSTLERQAQEQQTGLALADLASRLQGPENAFKFLRTMAGTPNGLKDLMNSALGQFTMPGFGGGQWNAENARVQTVPGLMNNIMATTGAPAYQQPQTMPVQYGGQSATPQYGYTEGPQSALPSMTYSAAQEQAPSNMYNYQPTGDGNYYVYPPGLDAPADAEQYNSMTPMAYDDVNNYINSLPEVHKINLENYGEMGDYQQDILKSAYGERGVTPDVFDNLLKKSMPRYGGGAGGAVLR